PTRHSLKLAIGGIVAGLLYKLVMRELGFEWAFVLLPGAIDFFCFGALIAYMEIFRPKTDELLAPIIGSPATIATLFLLWTLTKYLPTDPLTFCTIDLVRGML